MKASKHSFDFTNQANQIDPVLLLESLRWGLLAARGKQVINLARSYVR